MTTMSLGRCLVRPGSRAASCAVLPAAAAHDNHCVAERADRGSASPRRQRFGLSDEGQNKSHAVALGG
jgi:hypothetical protein